MGAADLVERWRQLITDGGKSWVLFENGTCVVVVDAGSADLARSAADVLTGFGRPAAGTATADFNPIDLRDEHGGWVVTFDHPDVLVFVPDEDGVVEGLAAGLAGRAARTRDTTRPCLLHVEDNRRRALV